MLQHPIMIAILFGLSIFFFILFFAAWIYDKSNQRMVKKDNNDWLFYHFNEKFYDAIFEDKLPEEVLPKLGIDTEEYYENCKLADQTPDPKGLAVRCVYGFLVLIISLLLTVVSPFFFFFGVAVCAFCCMGEKMTLKRIAEDKRYQIQCELPDFLDLLSAELAVGLPIEQAIGILTSRLDNLISKEFNWAFSNMELGAGSWLQALEVIALKYNVEIFNDFVSKISVAYEKGIPIDQTVRQEAMDIKQSHLMSIKDRAGKMTNTILLPIAIFQFVPMIAFIMIPVMVQIAKM